MDGAARTATLSNLRSRRLIYGLLKFYYREGP